MENYLFKGLILHGEACVKSHTCTVQTLLCISMSNHFTGRQIRSGKIAHFEIFFYGST